MRNSVESCGGILELWWKCGWKVTFLNSRLFTNVRWKGTFSAEKPSFWPIAAFWVILEHLYSEMTDEPPFHVGLLHIRSLLQIPNHISSCFHQGRKGIFQPLFKNIGEKMVFQPRLQQSLKNSTQVSYTKYILFDMNHEQKLKDRCPAIRPTIYLSTIQPSQGTRIQCISSHNWMSKSVESSCWILELWWKCVWKLNFLNSRLFANVLEQWLKRYLFTSAEKYCSCAKEPSVDWACCSPLWQSSSAAIS